MLYTPTSKSHTMTIQYYLCYNLPRVELFLRPIANNEVGSVSFEAICNEQTQPLQFTISKERVTFFKLFGFPLTMAFA